MYYYEQDEADGRWVVRDENGNAVCSGICGEADAAEIVAAMNLVETLARDFPGLCDGVTEVNGGDLVECINEAVEWDDDGRFKERVVGDGLRP
jgi:hypothetical protein